MYEVKEEDENDDISTLNYVNTFGNDEVAEENEDENEEKENDYSASVPSSVIPGKQSKDSVSMQVGCNSFNSFTYSTVVEMDGDHDDYDGDGFVGVVEEEEEEEEEGAEGLKN